VIVALQAPAALLVSFVPMFLIAGAFFYMNRADPDAGTTFSWVTRALGPWAGWIGGWAVFVTGILVIGSLADVGARYLYLIVGWDSAAASKEAVTALAVDHRRHDRDLHPRHGALRASADRDDPRPGRFAVAVRDRRDRQGLQRRRHRRFD
jgi:Amino acid permease